MGWGGPEVDAQQEMASLYIVVFLILGAEASQPETDRWGRDPEHCFRDGEV